MFTTLSVRVARWHDNGAAGPGVVPGGQLKRGAGDGITAAGGWGIDLAARKQIYQNLSGRQCVDFGTLS